MTASTPASEQVDQQAEERDALLARTHAHMHAVTNASFAQGVRRSKCARVLDVCERASALAFSRAPARAVPLDNKPPPRLCSDSMRQS